MAGMFYSLKETAEKLGRTEEEVKQLAKEGALREFRDGSNLLFKIEEVESILASGPAPEVASVEVPAEEQPVEAAPVSEESLDEIFDLEGVGEEPAAEEVGLEDFELVADEGEPSEPQAAAPMAEEDFELEPMGEAEGTSEFGLVAEPGEEVEATPEPALETPEPAPEAPEPVAEEDIFAVEEEVQPAAAGLEESDEISLAMESGMLGGESDISDMDTALTGQGVNVLGESSTDYDVTDDSMAETVGPAGTSTEASLEEIEDDVNLDSFGSGSGLLDLSLQADDTSLGGILDEIYTAEGGEEGAVAEPASVEDISAEADQVVPEEEELAAPQAVAVAPTIAPTAYVEAAPDTQSNILGILLFLPLAVLLYTAIVTVAAQRDVMPSILESVQGLIWYIMGGAAVVAVVVVGASFMAGGERTKAPTAKKARKERAPKEKKAKREKPKKEKPKKEKKPLFGKKK